LDNLDGYVAAVVDAERAAGGRSADSGPSDNS
jgi:hypothetical protein